MPRVPSRPELLVKPALPDGSLAMQAPEGPLKVHTLPNMRSGAASQTKGKTGRFQPLPQRILPVVTVIYPRFGFLKNVFLSRSCVNPENLLVVFASAVICFLTLNNAILLGK